MHAMRSLDMVAATPENRRYAGVYARAGNFAHVGTHSRVNKAPELLLRRQKPCIAHASPGGFPSLAVMSNCDTDACVPAGQAPGSLSIRECCRSRRCVAHTIGPGTKRPLQVPSPETAGA